MQSIHASFAISWSAPRGSCTPSSRRILEPRRTNRRVLTRANAARVPPKSPFGALQIQQLGAPTGAKDRRGRRAVESDSTIVEPLRGRRERRILIGVDAR